MDIAKIAAVAVTGTLLATLLRSKNPMFAALIALGCAVVMAVSTLSSLGEIFTGFQTLFESGGIDPTYYKNVIKVIGVAYFTEITSSLCRDAGESAIAAKLDMAGRILVLVLTMPAVTQLMSVIIEALSLI